MRVFVTPPLPSSASWAEISVNPLKHRLAQVFGFNDPSHSDGINFGTFVQKVAIFSERGSKQDKIKGEGAHTRGYSCVWLYRGVFCVQHPSKCTIWTTPIASRGKTSWML